MTLQNQIDELLAQRASQWVDALGGADAEDLEAFIEWVAESPRNLDEFLSTAALDRELEDASLFAGIDRAALLGKLTPPVAHLGRPAARLAAVVKRPRSRMTRWRKGALAAAAVAFLALAGAWIHDALSPSRHYATGVGELRSLELPDGSLVYLNARSQLRLRFSDTVREIHLTEGEAVFKAVTERRRPFQVRTRDALIKALGTEFNVAARQSGTRIAVLEGRVRVAPVQSTGSKAATLREGEAAHVAPIGKVRVSPEADIASAVAWRERRLIFMQAPLEEIVDEFNRFNRKPLRLEGLAPRARHYSGAFDADDPQALIAFLSRERDLEVRTGVREIVIRPR